VRYGDGSNSFILFGSSSATLTVSQLNQIQFYNPANFAAGTYPAQLLNSGEIVPLSNSLTRRYNGQQLVFSWDSGWNLQTTTNVGLPFVDVAGAISPYTNLFTDPQRFFRLRR